MGKDIADGMSYLSSMKIVHRFAKGLGRFVQNLLVSPSHLAARNCLVNEVAAFI